MIETLRRELRMPNATEQEIINRVLVLRGESALLDEAMDIGNDLKIWWQAFLSYSTGHLLHPRRDEISQSALADSALEDYKLKVEQLRMKEKTFQTQLDYEVSDSHP
jgi:hypothetical protein